MGLGRDDTMELTLFRKSLARCLGSYDSAEQLREKDWGNHSGYQRMTDLHILSSTRVGLMDYIHGALLH